VSEGLWVTGLGLVTPLGADVESTWSRLVRGERALAPVTIFDGASQRAGVVAEVPGAYLADVARWPAWSRASAMAFSAASEAMQMARLEAAHARVGLVVGGTTGGMFETEALLARLHVDPDGREPLAAMLSHPLSATADRLQERLGPFTRVRSLSSACSSGANALVVGAAWLLSGEVDAVVAGGCDGLCRLTLAGFNALGAIDPLGCRPFHRARGGTTLGEGAGFLVLERASAASARGATALAELAGWATGSEAHHITQPAPDGELIAALIAKAMARARVAPSDLDYVHAHGTGTPANDAAEVAALARALGREIARVPVSSSKGQIGHGLGAAGGVEAAITALVVARGVLVPTAGLDDPDPALDVVHVPHVGRNVGRVRAAISNAFGFGGMDAVLVLTEPSTAGGHLARSSRPDGPTGAPTTSVGVVVTGAALVGSSGVLDAAAIAALPDRAPRAVAPVDLDAWLDPARSRRFDAAARLAAVAVESVLNDSRAPREGAGLVLGSPFASVDRSAAFMDRVLARGPRAAPPADFPNLVPSAAVGNVSIYANLKGPAFSVADLSISAESAFAAAVDLVVAGEAPRVVVGASEPRSGILRRVRAVFFPEARDEQEGARGSMREDLAAVVLVEAEGAARARGATVLARIARVVEWRADGADAMRRLGVPRAGRREVVVARPTLAIDALLDATPWGDCPRIASAAWLGESDGLGAASLAVAAARIGAGVVTEALAIGVSGTSGVAVHLARAGGEGS
jgi:3-oxoacyl-[acyl-carrier-protein] synthase II